MTKVVQPGRGWSRVRAPTPILTRSTVSKSTMLIVTSRSPSSFEWAVELRLRKIRAGLVQDIIGLAKLTRLAFQRLDLFALFTRRSGPRTTITFAMAHPIAQCLARASNVRRNQIDRGLLRDVFALVLQNPSEPRGLAPRDYTAVFSAS